MVRLFTFVFNVFLLREKSAFKLDYSFNSLDNLGKLFYSYEEGDVYH